MSIIDGCTVVVCADFSIADLKVLDKQCRLCRSKLVATTIRGVCGYLFNDFLDCFKVLDVEGESHKEVIRNINVNSVEKCESSFKLTEGTVSFCMHRYRFSGSKNASMPVAGEYPDAWIYLVLRRRD